MLIIGAVQLINTLDFVMVMPLGPDFAAALHIAPSKLGWIGGAYTAAASIAGFAGAAVLNRFDRRKALCFTLCGLALGTAAGGLATSFATLLCARLIAGAFGGPATSVAYAIIADLVPPQRRGKAMGAVMAAFSVASVIGLPLGLELARRAGWRAPFFVVAALGLAVNAVAFLALPSLRSHVQERPTATATPTSAAALRAPAVSLSYLLSSLVMVSSFLIFPNLSPYVQFNLGFARKDLSTLYLVGGVFSFFATRYGGRLVDRQGSFRVGTVGTLVLVAVQLLFFVRIVPAVPVFVLFSLFMLGNALRNVAFYTLTSKVPSLATRARFVSIQSAIQHASAAAGAFVAAHLLGEASGGQLVGMGRIGLLAIALSASVPLLLFAVERRVRLASDA